MGCDPSKRGLSIGTILFGILRLFRGLGIGVNMFIVNVILYQIFAFILVSAGINVIDKPGYFLSLVGILVVVDILSHWNAIRNR